MTRLPHPPCLLHHVGCWLYCLRWHGDGARSWASRDFKLLLCECWPNWATINPAQIPNLSRNWKNKHSNPRRSHQLPPHNHLLLSFISVKRICASLWFFSADKEKWGVNSSHSLHTNLRFEAFCVVWNIDDVDCELQRSPPPTPGLDFSLWHVKWDEIGKNSNLYSFAFDSTVCSRTLSCREIVCWIKYVFPFPAGCDDGK